MNSDRFHPGLFLSPIAFLCGLSAAAMIQVQAANDLAGNKPSVELRASRTSITLPCPPGMGSRSGTCPREFDSRVDLTATAESFNKRAVYTYSVTAGQIIGEGVKVSWDLTGVGPGTYTATVEAQDHNKHRAVASVNVTVMLCLDCMILCDLPCPAIVVTCYEEVKAGTPITCKVNVQGGSDACSASVGWSPSHSVFKWSARSSNGDDLTRAITSGGNYVSIPTNGRAGQVVDAMVEIPGLDPTCNSRASSSTRVRE